MISRKQKAANQVNEWIRDHFRKRECVKILPVSKNSEKCGCGRYFAHHYYFEEERECSAAVGSHGWNVGECTAPFCTDAYGTLKFQGVSKPYRSTYIRLDHTAHPGDIWQLLIHVWGLEPPKLVITVCGGSKDFDLSPTFWPEFKNGLRRVVNTTSTWIVTSGVRAGVVKHVTAAISDFTPHRRKKNFTVIGIAPWGLIKRSDRLIGQNKCVNYYPFLQKRSKFVSLCEGHDCFLLVDNAFENYLISRRMDSHGDRLMPVVCLILGGGQLAVQTASEFVHSKPPVPLVICKNSGRAADLLAYAFERQSIAKSDEQEFNAQLDEKLEDVIKMEKREVSKWIDMIKECTSHSTLITIFTGLINGNSNEQLDCKILTALLQGRRFSSLDRLILLLMWNREDLVREMLESGYAWEENALDSAMMQALIDDRVEFVQLLLNNGVAMDAFLTPERLEDLYNTDKGPENTLSALMMDMTKEGDKYKKYRLPVIGLLIEKLMGNGYRGAYCRREFRGRYKLSMRGYATRPRTYSNDEMVAAGQQQQETPLLSTGGDIFTDSGYFFQNPFDDLFMWAVLTNRFKMAMLMWQNGDEPLTKALIAFKLFKSMAKEAKEDALELELCDRMKSNSREFGRLACELLDQCYQTNEFLTMQLLTYELANWGKKNCISLAAMAKNKEFIARPSCQILLSDLWQGGLRIRRNVSMKVLCAVLLPPLIFTLPFKTKEELMLQAQTAAEHQEHCDLEQCYLDSQSSSSNSDNELPDYDEPSTAGQVKQKPSVLTLQDRKISRRIPSVFLDSNAVPLDVVMKKEGTNVTGDRPPIGTTNMDLHQLASQATLMDAARAPRVSLQMPRMNPQSLSVAKKIREFYSAPITAFWSWTLSYLLFLVCFTYVVLVKAYPEPSWIEWYNLSYVAAFFADLVRKCLLNDARGLRDKTRVFSGHLWDRNSARACLVYFIGFGLRTHSSTMELGRVVLKVDVIYWYMYLLRLLTVSSKLGPYITIYGKMVAKMALLCIILFVLLISFGVVRQAITFPNEEWNWMLVRNIVYKPYFMLYGEVYAPEIDTCGDENQNCVYFHWLSPIFMTIYLLLSIIVFLNMMIAAFNFVFVNISAQSNLICKYQMYEQVMDYEQKSFLPPPFVLLSHLFLLVGHCCRRLLPRGRRFRRTDPSLKLFLSDSDVARLHDFENQCLEDVLERRRAEQHATTDSTIRDLTEKMDEVRCELRRMEARLEEVLCRANSPAAVRSTSFVPPISFASSPTNMIFVQSSPAALNVLKATAEAQFPRSASFPYSPANGSMASIECSAVEGQPGTASRTSLYQ